MRFFMVERHKFVLTNASPDTLKRFWHDYRAYHYDFDLSFSNFLEENGVYVRTAAPYFSLFGYDLEDIEITLN